MKIIQTFWTAGQDPLKHSFGWTHPEYNLMSWALSCLSLREFFSHANLANPAKALEQIREIRGIRVRL